jgi:hypothetical protein
VNLIVTFMLVDVDPAYQTILPLRSAGVIASNDIGLLIGSGEGSDATTELTVGVLNLVAQTVSAGAGGPIGRVTFSEELEQPFYEVPSEAQRPRLVTQMIMQNIQVLHVGTFPLPGEAVSESLIAPTPGPGPTATPLPATTEGTVTSVSRPDILTLMVTNQDAVTLTWLIYSDVQMTLTLRNPNDQVVGEQPTAATLEYLLTQYDIPVPAPLPYSIEPRYDLWMKEADYQPLFRHFYYEMEGTTVK